MPDPPPRPRTVSPTSEAGSPGYYEYLGRGEAVGLAGIAGVMFLAEGVFLYGSSVSLPFDSVGFTTAAAMSIAAGFLLLLFGAMYRIWGEARAYLGPLTILVAAGGVWSGGGFWVGTIVGTIAGLLMIVLPIYKSYV